MWLGYHATWASCSDETSRCKPHPSQPGSGCLITAAAKCPPLQLSICSPRVGRSPCCFCTRTVGPSLDMPFVHFRSSRAARVWRPLLCTGSALAHQGRTAHSEISHTRSSTTAHWKCFTTFPQTTALGCVDAMCWAGRLYSSGSVSAARQALCTKRQSPGPQLPEADVPRRCRVL
jgi:hypothetical protein